MTDTSSTSGKTLFKNSLWTIGTRISIRFLGVISIIILARLLAPDDFGIVAKAVMIQSLLELMTALGLSLALINKQNATEEHYNTVWTLQICRGLFICLVLVVLAEPSSEYFHEPKLVPLIYCYAAVSLLNGFINVGIVDFRKFFKFNLDFRYNLYRKIVSFATTITIAMVWQSYWALALGVVAGEITSIISSYFMSSYRPKICLNKWRELIHFSKWIMIHEMVTSLAYKIDTFILARFSTANVLGVFIVSDELARTPTDELGMSVARASSPSFAKLKNELSQMKSLYHRSLSAMFLVAAPAGVGISVLSLELTNLFLGEQWLDAVPLIEIIAITGVFTLFSSNSIPSLVAAGKVKYLSYLSTLSLIIRAAALAIGFMYNDVYGMVVAGLISIILYILISLSVQQFFKIFSFIDFLGLTWRIFVASIIMYYGLSAFKAYSYSSLALNDILNTVLIVILGVVIYGVSLIILWLVSGRCEGSESDIISLVLRKEID